MWKLAKSGVLVTMVGLMSFTAHAENEKPYQVIDIRFFDGTIFFFSVHKHYILPYFV